jgi:hypothetical protein
MLQPAKTRKITFGSTVSTSFSVNKKLDSKLLDEVAGFWKEKNLSIKKKELLKSAENGATSMCTLLAEGGTIWTIDFDQYKKTVSVSMMGNGGFVEVFIHMELIGGFMSEKDKEKALRLLNEFEAKLSS